MQLNDNDGIDARPAPSNAQGSEPGFSKVAIVIGVLIAVVVLVSLML